MAMGFPKMPTESEDMSSTVIRRKLVGVSLDQAEKTEAKKRIEKNRSFTGGWG